MKLEKIKNGCASLVRKAGKKTVIASMAVLVIGIAVLLNFLTLHDKTSVALNEELSEIPALAKAGGESAAASDEDYFASIALNRQSARDEAMSVLKTVTESDSAVEEVRNTAYDDIRQIASDIECEANIETLIEAKGFEQCIAIVNGSVASVIVKTPGLTPGELAQISEIVYNEAGIVPADLKIIERN
ncbi:MAG: SpoIIIAH-like family protein [Clostridia bacterium]|nr:SpoIIIAH-like family protein [Clostridia bacterium]